MGLEDHKHILKASGSTIVTHSLPHKSHIKHEQNTHFVVESLPSYGHICQIINNKTNTLQINLNLK